MEFVAPAAGAVAAVGLRVTVPATPDCVREKVLSPMVSVAVRGETELFAAAVQVMRFSAVVTVSQAGWPETVQDL